MPTPSGRRTGRGFCCRSSSRPRGSRSTSCALPRARRCRASSMSNDDAVQAGTAAPQWPVSSEGESSWQSRATIPRPTMESSGTGYVESRVPREEACRHEPEARAMDGHHWPVLRPGDVVDPHRVPENDIAVDERAVRLDPPRQTIASTSLIHELAGRVLLRRVIGRNPEVRTEEAGPLQQGRVGEEKWRTVLSGLEDIGDGLAESVPGPGVHDLPEAARAGMETARRLALTSDRRFRHAGHRGRSWRTGGGIHFEHGIDRTVHVHVETEVEPVLMMHALDVRRDHPSVRGMVVISALPYRRRLRQHDPDEQGLHRERSILKDEPVEGYSIRCV